MAVPSKDVFDYTIDGILLIEPFTFAGYVVIWLEQVRGRLIVGQASALAVAVPKFVERGIGCPVGLDARNIIELRRIQGICAIRKLQP
jgi:hypothetical protein